MIRRMMLFLFGCGHHAVVEKPTKAGMGIARCTLRARHTGEHKYPFGSVELNRLDVERLAKATALSGEPTDD